MASRITVILIALLHLTALLIFSNGFLLTRTVLEDKTPAIEHTLADATFKKAVILVIDALRFDFTIPNDDNSQAWHNKLTILHKLNRDQPEHTFLTRFVAHPPTTTLQRLKGLTTGSLPTFVDAGSNFGGEAILEDNILGQLKAANKSIAFVGDDTWQALFPDIFEPHLNFPFESLNVWDLDTVDDGVYHHLFDNDHAFLRHQDWDVVIAHALGLDHSGHRYGPDHPETTRKLLQMDQWIEQIIETLDEDTVFIVMGDHGMNAEGDHGGDSYDELNAALFMYTKQSIFQGGTPTDDPGVCQIDLVPTLSLLLGLPIPFNNLGSPIAQAFAVNPVTSMEKATQMTTDVLNKYIDTYGMVAPVDRSNQLEWQREVLRQFEKQWAQYDLPSIVFGCAIMSSTMVLSSLIYASGSSSIATFSMSSFVTALLIASIIFLHNTLSVLYLLVTSLTAVFTAFLAYSHRQYSPHPSIKVQYFNISIVILHTAIFASNSFTIHEDKIALLLANTLTLHLLIKAISLKQYEKAGKLALVMVLSRIATTIRLCREEQGSTCVSTFTRPNVFLVAASILVASALYLIRQYSELRKSGNLTGHMQVCLGGFGLSAVLISIYWTLDLLDFDIATRLLLARTILSLILAQFLAWIVMPLPVSFKFTDTLTVLGGRTLRSAAHFQGILPLLSLLVFLGRSYGSASLCVLLLQISLLDQNLVLMLELAMLHFFSTGHQMTLPAIQWDLAFLVSKRITVLSPAFIVVNAFSGVLMVALHVPLFRKDNKADDILPSLGLQTLFSAITCSTMIFAGHFRRHLMVWKIFAPRFMTASLMLLVLDLALLFNGLITSLVNAKVRRFGQMVQKMQ